MTSSSELRKVLITELKVGNAAVEFASVHPHVIRGCNSVHFRTPYTPVSSDGIRLGPAAAGQLGWGVRIRRAAAGGIWGPWHMVWRWASLAPTPADLPERLAEVVLAALRVLIALSPLIAPPSLRSRTV
jgi:hypothetical protein